MKGLYNHNPYYTASFRERVFFLVHGYFPKSYGRKALGQVLNALTRLYRHKAGKFYETFFARLTDDEREKLDTFLATARSVSNSDPEFNEHFNS